MGRYELTLENVSGTDVVKVGVFDYLSDAINKIIGMAPEYEKKGSRYDVAKIKDSSFCYIIVYEQVFNKNIE